MLRTTYSLQCDDCGHVFEIPQAESPAEAERVASAYCWDMDGQGRHWCEECAALSEQLQKERAAFRSLNKAVTKVCPECGDPGMGRPRACPKHGFIS